MTTQPPSRPAQFRPPAATPTQAGAPAPRAQPPVYRPTPGQYEADECMKMIMAQTLHTLPSPYVFAHDGSPTQATPANPDAVPDTRPPTWPAP